jgi:hypothetical protein
MGWQNSTSNKASMSKPKPCISVPCISENNVWDQIILRQRRLAWPTPLESRTNAHIVLEEVVAYVGMIW